jgi:hypothetical protein
MSKWYKTKEREQRNPVQQRRSRHAARRNERPARPARWSWRQFASPGARHGILFEGGRQRRAASTRSLSRPAGGPFRRQRGSTLPPSGSPIECC